MANVWAQNTDVECIAPGDKPDGSRRDIWSLQGGLLENFGDIKKLGIVTIWPLTVQIK